MNSEEIPHPDDEELLACFNKENIDKFHTGRLKDLVFPIQRKTAHSDKISHIICRIYGFNINGEFLVQKRSEHKRSHSGLFTDSASGHIRYSSNFTYEHIIEESERELEEEMGTTFLHVRFMDLHLEKFRSGDCELAYNFIALVDNTFTPHKTEVSPESGFMSKEKFILLLKEKKSEFVKITHTYWNRILSDSIVDDMIQYYQKSQCLKHSMDKEGVIGAIIGRFQPPHHGHLKVIHNALCNTVAYLKIGIGSAQYSNTKENPYSYEDRKKMLYDACLEYEISPNQFSISPIDDLHDINKWIPEVLEVLGDFDIFFSNSAWTRDLFAKIGKVVSPLVKFDFERYNGTNVRNKIKSGEDVSDLIPKSVNKYLKLG